MSVYSSALTIEELDTDRTVLRSLNLYGPALPKMGASWGGENALKTNWYPGNPDEGTQIVLVPKEVPSEWEGEWNITRLNRQPSRYIGSAGGAATGVVSPGFLVDICEDIFRKGRRLRVTWVVDSDDSFVNRTVLREGRARTWNWKYRTSVDIEWTVTFEWQSRGTSQQRVVATRDNSGQDATTALQTAMAGTKVAVNALIASENNPDLFSLGGLEKLADSVLESVGSFETAIENQLFSIQKVAGLITQFKNLPFNVASQILGTATDVLGTCNLFADSISRTPIEQQILSDQVDDLTRNASAIGACEEQALAVARQAQITQQQMRSVSSIASSTGGAKSVQSSSGTNQGNQLAIRVTKQGDTPSSLSNLYYGSPDHDIDILRCNDLPWHQVSFVPGTILVIPVVNTAQGP